MAPKQAVSKTQAVRDYLSAHPGAGTREIVAALDKQGIRITFEPCRHDQSSDVRDRLRHRRRDHSTASRGEAATDTLTPEQIKMRRPSDEEDTVTLP